MNAINAVVSSLNVWGEPFCRYAVAMLIQSSILIGLLLAVDFLIRPRVRAVVRYALWMLVLLKLLLPPGLTSPVSVGSWLGGPWTPEPAAVEAVTGPLQGVPVFDVPEAKGDSFPVSLLPVETEPAPTQPVRTAVTAPAPKLDPLRWQGWVLLGWLTGVVVLGSLLIHRSFFVMRLLRRSEDADSDLCALLDECCEVIGIRRGKARLKILADTVSPAVCGVVRATILLQRYLVDKLDRHQLRSALIHELAHIRRHDLFVNLVQTLLQVIYFYNPLLWLTNAIIRRVREQAVDEMVLVSLGRHAPDYSHTLIDIAEMAFHRPSLSLRLIGVVESKKALTQRIRHIVSRPLPKTAKVGVLGLMAVVAVGAVLLPMAKSETTPGASATATPRRYSFQAPDDSLRKEPQRPAPLALELVSPPPERAVVFGWPIRWWGSHWSSGENTDCVAQESLDDAERFIVTEPRRRKVWVKYFDIPIDPHAYPILAMTYRATNTETNSSGYALWMDDETGPGHGGLSPFGHNDLIADGQVHTLTSDLRASNPRGQLTGLAIAVYSDHSVPACFDLVDLRFQADREDSSPLPMDVPIEVRVMDIARRPLPGATVTVDAERSNWAQRAVTDNEGMARIVPFRTKSGRHMIRVASPGMLTAEIRDLLRENESVPVVLGPACTYGGSVVDEGGSPVAEASVRIRVGGRGPSGPWTRRDAVVLTDERGRWESPPLAADARRIAVAVAHPEYRRRFGGEENPRPEALRAGEAALAIARGWGTVRGCTVDAAGNPVAGATVRAITAQTSATSGATNVFKIDVFRKGDILLVRRDGYAPAVVALDAREIENGELTPVCLSTGQVLRVLVEDPEGKPVPDATVTVHSQLVRDEALVSLRTDADGKAEWSPAPTDGLVLDVACSGFAGKRATVARDTGQRKVTLKPLPTEDKDDKKG